MKCQCSCHVTPIRDTHVSSWGGVIWCCGAPFSPDPPELPPTPMFSIEVVEVKPMEIPNGLKVFTMDYRYGDAEYGKSMVKERRLMDYVREFWSGKKR